MTAYYTNTFFTLTSKELYEKAQLEYKTLIEDISPYNIFNFFVTAYHLKDYIKSEFDLNETDDIRDFGDMNELLNIAGFIANKGKHFELNNSHNMETRYYSGKGDGTMLCDGTWCIGEGEAYKIMDNEEIIHSIQDLAKRFMDEWEKFIDEKELF